MSILNTYPNATHAVAWCELVLSPNSYGPEDRWYVLRKLNSIDSVLKVLKETMKAEIKEGDGLPVEMLTETDTKDFRNYLMAKLGMM